MDTPEELKVEGLKSILWRRNMATASALLLVALKRRIVEKIKVHMCANFWQNLLFNSNLSIFLMIISFFEKMIIT